MQGEVLLEVPGVKTSPVQEDAVGITCLQSHIQDMVCMVPPF